MNEKDFHRRVRDVFTEALEREEFARAEYLDRACRDDERLRAEVAALLAAFAESEEFIERPAIELPNVLARSRPPKILGNYRIVREIGQGGMGTVYLAERADGQFEQKVAVKIVRQTFIDGEIVRRFRNERQILAQLEHRNIARLLDGGLTGDGQPFLVMEYVDGRIITDFCRNLPLREILIAFLKVCRAVAYAHRNMIVHRDIKPSNILIDRENEPKLLDFGLAKLTADNADSVQTKTAFHALTPAYASPEQLQGGGLSAASDIYSLGVVLYELLTGARPFETEGKSFEEIVRTVTMIDPVIPSAVSDPRFNPPASKRAAAAPNRKLLKGDLDNIVMTALRKEPARRYQSVELFAQDIENYLDGLPVVARPNTFAYRAEKFFKRHTAPVIAAALIFLTLVGGLIYSIRQTENARALERKAALEAEKSKKVTAFMEQILNYANPAWYAAGSSRQGEAKLIEVIDDLSDRIETEFPDDPEIGAELHHKFAEIYLAKGRTEQSFVHAERALELRRRAFGEKNAEVAKDYYYLGAATFQRGEIFKARQLYEQSIDIFREVAPDNPNFPYALEDAGTLLVDHFSDFEKARSYFLEALAIFRRKDGENHYNTARTLIYLSAVYGRLGDQAKSEELAREGENRYQELPEESLREGFIFARGWSLLVAGDWAGYQNLFESRLAELEKKGAGESPTAQNIRRELSGFYQDHDLFEKELGMLRYFHEAERRSPFPDKIRLKLLTLMTAYNLLRLGRENEARPYFEDAYPVMKQTNSEAQWLYDACLGECLFYLKRGREAEPFLRNALEKYTANIPPSKPHRKLADLLSQIK
ncbi:MAG: serine/threonine protein kinase [Acidobacteria bacterium]|nr:serine/threonine protein kinase [Acidobacteriota bacterium]